MAELQWATKPSTVAGTLDDKSGLETYLKATTLRTVAAHPDLMTRLALTRDSGWKSYQPLVDEAEARGGKPEASDGTNIHMVVEAMHHGINVENIPEPARSDGMAVHAAILAMGLEIIDAELFVVTQGLPELCAGTLDLLLRAPNGDLFVGDIKSVGKFENGRYGGLKWSIQTAIYNHGIPYTGPEPQRDRWKRPKIDPDLVKLDWPRPNMGRALILQVERGKADVRPTWVNTERGWFLAGVACEIRKVRKEQAQLVVSE